MQAWGQWRHARHAAGAGSLHPLAQAHFWGSSRRPCERQSCPQDCRLPHSQGRANGRKSNVGVPWRRPRALLLTLALQPALRPLGGPLVVQRIVDPQRPCCANGEHQDVSSRQALRKAHTRRRFRRRCRAVPSGLVCTVLGSSAGHGIVFCSRRGGLDAAETVEDAGQPDRPAWRRPGRVPAVLTSPPGSLSTSRAWLYVGPAPVLSECRGRAEWTRARQTLRLAARLATERDRRSAGCMMEARLSIGERQAAAFLLPKTLLQANPGLFLAPIQPSTHTQHVALHEQCAQPVPTRRRRPGTGACCPSSQSGEAGKGRGDLPEASKAGHKAAAKPLVVCAPAGGGRGGAPRGDQRNRWCSCRGNHDADYGRGRALLLRPWHGWGGRQRLTSCGCRTRIRCRFFGSPPALLPRSLPAACSALGWFRCLRLRDLCAGEGAWPAAEERDRAPPGHLLPQVGPALACGLLPANSCWLLVSASQQVIPRHLPYPIPAALRMTDHTGRPFTAHNLLGSWALIDFGTLDQPANVKGINSICRQAAAALLPRRACTRPVRVLSMLSPHPPPAGRLRQRSSASGWR